MVTELRKGKSSESQRHSQIKVATIWQPTQEVSPAFKRLMQLLLCANNGGKDGDRRERIERTERQDADLL